MARSRTDTMQMYRIAKLYYEDGLTQQQIAAAESISRSQISRLLDQARECGVVRISVCMPEEVSLSEMAEELERKLKLKEVVIAPLASGAREEETIEAIATAAAGYLPRELKNCRTVGIGWGRTVYRMSCTLSYRSSETETLFVPLIGASGTDNPSLQINSIIDRVAERSRGHNYFVSAPAFREDTVNMPELERKRLQKLHQYWQQLDAAVVGLGSRSGAERFFVSEVSNEYAESLRSSKAIGDILCQFFLADGALVPEMNGYQRMSCDIGRLRQIPRVICLAGSPEKTEAIITAARAGYFNILVTDSVTAKCIFEKIRS